MHSNYVLRIFKVRYEILTRYSEDEVIMRKEAVGSR